MNNEEALALLERDLAGLRDSAFADVASRVSAGAVCYERIAPSGVTYQIEIDVFWEDRPGGNIHVVGSIDDGGWWSSFRPLTRSFMRSPDGSFVGE